MFCKKDVLRIFIKPTRIHLCQSLFFNKVAGLRPAALIKRGSGTGELETQENCEFCEISKSAFFHRTPPVAASIFMWTR